MTDNLKISEADIPIASEENIDQRASIRRTIQLIKSDVNRMRGLMNVEKSLIGTVFLFLTPSIMALHLYRWSFYFYSNNFRIIGRFIWLANNYITGADISPQSKIGESCYIGHPVGTVISGKLGNKVTMFCSAKLGGGVQDESDIGGGAGLPVVEDNVVIGINATILGPVNIGEGAQIGACSLIFRSIPAGKVTVGSPARLLKSSPIDYEAIAGISNGGK